MNLLATHLAALVLPATLLLTVALAAIARIDAATLRIPDALSLPLIAAGLLWAALLPGQPLAGHLIGAAAGYVSLALIGEVYFRKTGTEGLGLGDAKLYAAAGAWLGWQALPPVLLIAATAGLIAALTRSRHPDASRALAFGPWLALGFWLVWLWQILAPLAWDGF